jgi:hypothetical protein
MKRIFAIALFVLPLAGCLPDGDSYYVPTDVASLFGGGAAVRPAPPAAQPNLTGTAGAMMAREVHGAVHAEDCYTMEARFKREGRAVKLVRVMRNDIGVGGVLQWKCIFDDQNTGEADSGYYEPRY